MRKLFNSLIAILSLPLAWFWLVFYSLKKDDKEKEFYSLYIRFILHAITTGKFESPDVYAKNIHN